MAEDLNFTINGNSSTSLQINSSTTLPQPAVKSIYSNVPALPVMEAPEGILYDFNDGCRIKFPDGNGKWHITFSDLDTGTILYSADVQGGNMVTSVKKYYIKFHIAIFHVGEQKPFFEHILDLKDKEVLIQYPAGAVGDTIGWFSFMERFQKKHQCKLTCVLPEFAIGLFQKQYPDIKLIKCGDKPEKDPYATYYMGLFFRCNTSHQPIDFRQVGLHKTAAHILGVSDQDIPPRVDLSAKKTVKGKYCVISTQASSMAKHWNNPGGWDQVIQFLRSQGYKVFCINKDRNYGDGEHWKHIPWGVEDATGPLPTQERVNLIKDADFFIGLSSGASWLAWCCKVPIVLISGFTLPFCEYYTPYRIINYNVCTGCWDDRKENFDHSDFMWCPRHKGTPQAFECTKAISAEHVINTIKKIPSFRPAK